jgi:alkaline phosphatase
MAGYNSGMAKTRKTAEDGVRFSRRSLLKVGAAVAAAAGAGGMTHESAMAAAEAQPAKGADKRLPKNIIYMVSDGMSMGVPRIAQLVSHAMGKGETNWAKLMSDPDAVHGLFDMSALNTCVTDSAAASSSWGSGSRVLVTWLNVLPDGTKLTTLAQIAKGQGKRVGLVTTATLTHATPAGFVACADKRSDESEIARQYLGLVDVALGGGMTIDDKPLDHRLRETFVKAGYALALTPEGLKKNLGAAKVLGCFNEGFLPYAVDRANDAFLMQQVPSLAEMGRAAIKMLSQGKDGFLLQIEGARIDHACHYNDALALAHEQLAFDEAVGMAYEYAMSRDDTLLVVTSDHGNANPGVMSMGAAGKDSTKYVNNVLAGRASLEVMNKDLAAMPAKDRYLPATLAEVFKKGTGAPFTAEQLAAMSDVMQNKRPRLHAQLDSPVGVYGQIMTNFYGIGFNCTQHTSDNTIITAIGPGADRFAGLIANTRAFTALTDLMGKPFKNPEVKAEDVVKFGALQVEMKDEVVTTV